MCCNRVRSGAVGSLRQSAQWLASHQVSWECSWSLLRRSSLHLDMIVAAASVPIRVLSVRVASPFSRWRVAFLRGRVWGHLPWLQFKLVRGGRSLETGVWRPVSVVIIWRLGGASWAEIIVIPAIPVPVRTELGVVRVASDWRWQVSFAGAREAGGGWLHGGWLWPAEAESLVEQVRSVSVVMRAKDGRWHWAGWELGVRHGNPARWLGTVWSWSQRWLHVPVSLVIGGGGWPGSGAGSPLTRTITGPGSVDTVHPSIRQTLHLNTTQSVNQDQSIVGPIEMWPTLPITFTGSQSRQYLKCNPSNKTEPVSAPTKQSVTRFLEHGTFLFVRQP